MKDLSLAEYRSLAEFRYQIRRFLGFSEELARAAGMEPQQHQLLLAIKGLPEGVAATIGELAERLQLKHHSTVELVNRLEKLGYTKREASKQDRRQVMVHLTRASSHILRKTFARSSPGAGDLRMTTPRQGTPYPFTAARSRAHRRGRTGMKRARSRGCSRTGRLQY